MNYYLINFNLIYFNMNKLPLELNNKIYFMACGHKSLTLTLQHKKVCKELLRNKFFLFINDGLATPDLYITLEDYFFAKRIPKLIRD